MLLERLLQINVATLAALGALLLGMGQRSTTTPLLVGAAAVVSVLLTDVTGWFRLHRTVAGLAALAAVAVALRQALRYQGEGQILVIANLLVFLQVVLLLQQKDNRIYWQLIMLSLLEVVVATLFSQGLWFGFLIWVQMAVGCSALALLMLWRQWQRHQPSADAPSPPPPRGCHRWPLAGQAAVCRGAAAGPDTAGVGGELFRRLALMGLGTMGLCAAVFFALPRLGHTAWRGAVVSPRRVVGFDDQVLLGALGEIIESPEEVMRVELRRGDDDEPYETTEGLYLRGAVLHRYRGGRWSLRRGTSVGPPLDARPEPPDKDLVVQRITVEPLTRDELFCVWPPVLLGETAGVHYDARNERLLRPLRYQGRRYAYELGTTGLAAGRQSPLAPCDALVDAEALLEMPELPRLAALAARWDAQSGLPEDDAAGRAVALERQFHRSPEFRYSLKGQARNLALDPIEDFVSENTVGHCEYYATALALMLRSRGIPSRVVIGYHTDEYNSLGRFFQVRQLHAHAWVEAYLEPGQLPAEQVAGDDRGSWAGGGWLRLDPTPGSRGESSSAMPILAGVQRGFDWLQQLWSNYVMEMDRRRQREAVYEPIVRGARRAVEKLGDAGWWRETFAALGRLFDFRAWGGAGRAVAAIVALGLLGAAAVGLGIVLGRIARRRRGRRPGTGDHAGRRPAAEIEFYRRLEATLARHGLARSPAQTHREFAARAGAQLATLFRHPELAPLPSTVAEAYYAVRFGCVPLDDRRAEAVELALEQLDALAGSRRL